jgi:hypothetical protein
LGEVGLKALELDVPAHLHRVLPHTISVVHSIPYR